MNFYQIPLKAIPNQSLSFRIESLNVSVNVKIKQLESIVIMDLYVNNELIFRGLNCKLHYNLLKPFKSKVNFNLCFTCSDFSKDKFTYLDFEKGVGLYYVI